MSKQSAFELGAESIKAGSRALVHLPVARIPTGQQLDLPVHVLHGVESGPTLFVSAALHGDELNGVAAIRHILRRLDPKRMSGTLLALPVVNGFGLLHQSRYLPDRRDLNRSFPGSARGSLTARLAHLFLSEVVARCSLGIDLHSGSGGRTNLPQIRCDLTSAVASEAASAFGGPLILHSKLRPGSLRGAASKVGATVLLHEAGEAHRLNRAPVNQAIGGVLRVLAAQGMLHDEVPGDSVATVRSRKSKWVRAAQSGICEMIPTLGEHIDKGAALAVLYDPSSLKEQTVRSPVSGLVIGLQRQTLVYRGDALVHVAQVGEAWT